MSSSRSGFIALFACLFLPLAAPLGAQDLLMDLKEEIPADATIDKLTKNDGADLMAGTPFRLVTVADPSKDIGAFTFWRTLAGTAAANTWPVKFELAGKQVIGPRTVVLPNEGGLDTVYEPKGAGAIPDGEALLLPGSLPIRSENGKVSVNHPALRVDAAGLRILCAPVRFETCDPAGTPVPFSLRLSDGKVGLLRGDGPYNPLVIWLPVGVRYQSSFGDFEVTPEGAIKPLKLAETVVPIDSGFRRTVAATRPRAPNLAKPPSNKLFLFSHRQRTVFAQGERAPWFVLAPEGFRGGAVEILAGDIPLGRVDLPAVTDRPWDSRGFLLDTAALPNGAWKLTARAAGATSAPVDVSVVPWERRSPFLVQTMSCCTGPWPTDDAGLEVLKEAGLEMAAAVGHASLLGDGMPILRPPKDPALPPEAGWVRSANDDLLERCLRHRLRMIDYAVLRAHGFYLEGLSYHHSYQPDVDRTVRRLSVFTQQTAEYPSFWGVNYAWFPKIWGYAEGGVPTDAHVADRNRALNKRLKAGGLDAPPQEDIKWYQEHKFSADSAERTRALGILKRRIDNWKASQAFSFGDHNALYNAAVRRVRPDVECTLFDNAGHDADNRARSQFNDMSASCYESYTDYGEWPMSAGFTTDWARGSNPGRPVWLTVDWGSDSVGMMKSLFHAFARGLQGGGCPMQAEAGLKELARRGMGLRLLGQYGTLARSAQPDSRVGILATLSQRVFDGRAYYAYHAIYAHLTRLGYPPALLDEEDVLARGIPETTRVLFIVRQEQPLTEELLKALRAFQARGGKILATGDSKVELDGVTKVGGEVTDIWKMSGFHPGSHQDMWKQFTDVWSEPLSKAMAQTGLPPLATTDPEQGLALAMDVGPVRYVTVIADAKGTHYGDFRVTTELPVSLDGSGWIVRDLVRQEPVTCRVQNSRTELAVDLVTEPITILALYRSAPAAILIRSAGDTRFTASVKDAGGQDMGAVPLAFTFVDPAGKSRDTLFRAAGDEADFRVPGHDVAGTWTVRIQELLSGLTVEHTWTPPKPAALTTIAPMAPVQVVDERQLRLFAETEGEKVVMVEPDQTALLPLARQLTEQLKAAGAKVRLWEVKPEDYDTIPLRWYPTLEDEARLLAVQEGRLIGCRGQLTPYIDKKNRVHVPARGGYSDIEPAWMLGVNAILFSGGRLAESLRSVTAWMPTPTVPGKGQGRIVVSFSPFCANRHVAVIAANDPEGYQAAAKRFVETMSQAARPAPPPPVAAPVWKDFTPPAATTPVPTPLVGMVPYRRALQLLALPDGRSVLSLAGRKDNLVFLGPDGKILGTFSKAGHELSLDAQGCLWVYRAANDTVTAECLTSAGQIVRRVQTRPGQVDAMRPPNRSLEASFPVGPDGTTAAFARFGGLMLGDLARGAWRFYDDVPHVRRRYEVWSPRFPVGMTFSPDGRYLFFTMETRPTGFTSMSGPAVDPTGTEAVLIEVATGQRIWSQREPPAGPDDQGRSSLDSCRFATGSGFAAVAAEGKLTALADFMGQAILIDKSGKVLMNHKADWTPVQQRGGYSYGPATGVGVWLSQDGALAAFGYRSKLVLAREAKPLEIALTNLVSGAVTADGSLAVAGLGSGEIRAYGPDGRLLWTNDCGGISPRLAAVGPGHVLVANHKGEVMRYDAAGRELWRVRVAEVADAGIHVPTDAADLPAVPPPVEYREPGTLETAKALLSAKSVAAWTPAGEASTFAGRTFFRVGSSISLKASVTGEAFLHLVYRRPAGNTALTVILTGKDGRETFILDLPTPEYRVIDLPARGPDVTVEVKMEGPVDIAECALWQFQWPSPNLAYVKEARAEGEGGLEAPDGGDLAGLGDFDDLDKDGAGLEGKLKNVKLYSWNPDPDKVQGLYLRPGLSALKVVDGRRFGNGQLPAWSGKDCIGPFFVEDLPYAVPLLAVATYERANRQSGVSRYVAVFTDFDPASRDSGTVLGGAVFNDQFWRLFPVGGKKAKQIGVHVRSEAGPFGLSEVEAYPGH